ncbi:hypothetical protein [Brumimicrobium oceani]|uniref:Uncharacterized protein n=1 Tax=Brumimicrobium oceani TaxID=2100725 RepID=A0A2U2XAL5_9FLAO|nr:hypothetical protein [Brumimicrobium oceani]PWH84822.1 hypothetical protein DIT68_12915 [Brumimicrobium oceani]
MIRYIKYNGNAISGGLTVAIFTALGVALLGNITDYEARGLLENSLEGLNRLCNTIIFASGTILTLLLTLLGVSFGTNKSLKERHYFQILKIAKFDVILFVSALILYQLFNFPILESDNVPIQWFSAIYWITLIVTSLLSGLMITVILMLYNTVKSLVTIIGLNKDHELLYSENLEEEIDEENSNNDR